MKVNGGICRVEIVQYWHIDKSGMEGERVDYRLILTRTLLSVGLLASFVPFIWDEEQWKLLFIHRANAGEFHRGEVAFPGGAADISDSDLAETALRECQEELGIPKDKVELLGFLPQIQTISKYQVTPLAGCVDWPQKLEINTYEVDGAFSIPVDWLMEPKNWSIKEFITSEGLHRETIFYEKFRGEVLWGMTARLTMDLLEKAKQPLF